MLTALQVQNAIAAAQSAGIANPGPATIAFYAFAPDADANAVVAALQAIQAEVDTTTVNSDIAAMNTEAQQNTPAAQISSVVQQIGGVLVPIVAKAVGV